MAGGGGAERESLASRVAGQLENFIVENSLHAGDRLPTERELCALLGVSRTVVREAVRTLVAKGLLEVRQGRGTLVRAPDVGLVSELITNMLRSSGGDRIAFPRVHEVRRLLEVEIAGLAAERRTPDDLALVEHRLVRCAQAGGPEEWARADVEFHAALAESTHNLLFPALLGSMAGILTELRLTAAALPGTQPSAQRHHESIFAAVRDSSPAAARRAMREHMQESEETFQRARVRRAMGDRAAS